MPAPRAVYFMRHGRTPLDDMGRSDSGLDLPLSDDGRKEVVQNFTDFIQGVPVSLIWANGLKRTKETAEILKSGLANAVIQTDDNISTWNLGDLAGNPKDETKPKVQQLLQNRSVRPPNGESYNEFISRFDPAILAKLKSAASNKSDGPIIIILSGSTLRRTGELLFGDRNMLDMDEAGIAMLLPEDNGTWSANVLVGYKEDHDEAS